MFQPKNLKMFGNGYRNQAIKVSSTTLENSNLEGLMTETSQRNIGRFISSAKVIKDQEKPLRAMSANVKHCGQNLRYRQGCKKMLNSDSPNVISKQLQSTKTGSTLDFICSNRWRPKSAMRPFSAVHHLSGVRPLSAMRHSSKPAIESSSNHSKCFPIDMSLLASGKLQKAFVKPIVYKFGQNFKNKSEENRYGKVAQQIINLRHLLKNDPVRSHQYILNFLLQFYTNDEIIRFTEGGLQHFISTVISFNGDNNNLSVKDFIEQCLLQEAFNS